MGDTTNISQGGINNKGDITLGQGDITGRDKITNIANYYGDAVPAALSLRQLPAPPADFTGRVEELADLLALLDAGQGVTLSGLHGIGGVGKTALALKLAGQIKDRYPDAQFFLDLRGAGDTPLSPADAMAHVIRAYYPLNKLPDSEAELRALYHSVLDGKRALLLMDNARDAAQVAPLRPPATCCLLVTSRQHIHLPGLKAKSLDAMKPGEARELLIKVAPRLGAGENRVDEIAKLCGCLPLALTAAGSLLAETEDLDPADLAQQLRDERARLELTGFTASGLETSIEASLNLSYARLAPDAARVFCALAVFPSDFEAQAEEAICDDPGHKHLSDLVKRSLTRYEAEKKRYSLHDLARIFADARLSATDRATLQLSHATHYETVLRAARKLYEQGGENIKQGLASFDAERGNIEAGQVWAVGQIDNLPNAAKLCSDYADAGVYVIQLRLHPREQIRWLEAALAAARKLKDRGAEGAWLGNLGIAYKDLGETRKAIEYHEQCLTVLREIGDRRGEGASLGNLGVAYYNLGETRKAIEFYEQHLTIAREIGDRRGEGNALGNLGNAWADLGETRKAIEFYEQVLTIAREIGDRRGEGNALGSLGNAYYALGETRKAIEFYEQRLVIAREIGDRRGEGGALGNLGSAYYNLGETRKAIEYHEQHLTIARDIGDRRGEGNALNNLGVAYKNLGETRKAIEYHEQYLTIAREIGDRRGESAALWNMSLALDKLGERAQAIAHAEAALKIREAIEDPRAEKVRKQLAAWREQGKKK
jgi:tetratricopeptide (TPR) repeat protein